MANQIIATTRYMDEATILANSTQATELPAENIQVFGARGNPFRSTVLNPAFVEMEFLKPRSIGFVGAAGLSAVGHRNLIPRSHLLNDVLWVATAATVTMETTILDPENGLRLFDVAGTAVVTDHYIEILTLNRPSLVAQYTLSLYVKAGVLDDVMLKLTSAVGEDAWAKFDLTGGTVSATGDNGAWTYDSSGIAAVGGGIARITLTATAPVTATTMSARLQLLSGTTESFSSTDSVKMFGAQCELGSVATTLIEVGTTGDVGALWRWIEATTQAKLTGTPEFDGGLQNVAMEGRDFRDWRAMHTHYIPTTPQQYKFARIEIYDEGGITHTDIGRVLPDDPWTAQMLLIDGVDAMGFSEDPSIQISESGAAWVVARPKRRGPSYDVVVRTESDAYDRYLEMSRTVGSSGEVYFIKSDAAAYAHRDSLFGLCNWGPLIQDQFWHRGGFDFLETEVAL